jgi:hypothetical protein
MSFDWNRFKGDYMKWEQPGVIVDGTVIHVGLASGFGAEYPELKIRTADGDVIVSATQSGLQRQLAENPPAIGDDIAIEYLGESDKAQPGRNPAKLFRVTVTHRSTSVAADDLV